MTHVREREHPHLHTLTLWKGSCPALDSSVFTDKDKGCIAIERVSSSYSRNSKPCQMLLAFRGRARRLLWRNHSITSARNCHEIATKLQIPGGEDAVRGTCLKGGESVLNECDRMFVPATVIARNEDQR
eukprot:scaffold33673_cov215-Skeletonema_dohrnii-CCMP3373.AAC.4